MKTQANYHPIKHREGSTMVLILIMLIGISVILGSAINLSMSESRTNQRHMLRHEAVMASESLSEYVFAEVMDRFETMSAINLVNDSLVNDPIDLNSNSGFANRVRTFYNDSSVIVPVAGSTSSSTSEIILSEIPATAERTYISKTDSNKNDPLGGKLVDVRKLEVLTKVVAKDDTRTMHGFSSDIVAYSQEILEIRDAPLLSHAIFYNMDLELHPGPTMDIRGPVHANEDFYLMAVNKITFHEGITAAGRILHEYKQTGSKTKQSGKVYIKDSDGNNVDMKGSITDSLDENGDGWLDNDDANWKEASDVRWHKEVKDSAHGVPTYNPIGIEDYQPIDMNVAEGGSNVIGNYAYAIIEPVLSELNDNYTGVAGIDPVADAVALNKFRAIREEKIAFKAGLVLKVAGTARSGSSMSDESLYTPSNYHVTAWKHNRDSNGNVIIDSGTGLPQMTQVMLPSGLVGAAASNLRSVDSNGNGEVEPFTTSNAGTHTSGDVVSGLYDHREDKGLDMITIDMQRLRELVDDTDPDYIPFSSPTNPWKQDSGAISRGEVASIVDPNSASGSTLTSAPISTFNPATDWNGVVYVEVPTEQHPASTTATPPRSDRIVSGSNPYLGVQIINGKYDASTGKGGAPAPTHDDDMQKGLFIGTNAPMYTIGHINSNGVAHSNDSNTLDRQDEPPMAIASDSLTLLSENWYPDTSDNQKDSNENSTGNRKGTYTEFSAAIITGLKPTVPSGSPNEPSEKAISGGAHNFPRFLEKWSSTLTIRGSLIALWESEVHEKAMPGNFGHYYSPPTRDWGFNDNFRNGNYPPGAPNVRDYSRVAIGQISEQEYNARKLALTTP